MKIISIILAIVCLAASPGSAWSRRQHGGFLNRNANLNTPVGDKQ